MRRSHKQKRQDVEDAYILHGSIRTAAIEAKVSRNTARKVIQGLLIKTANQRWRNREGVFQMEYTQRTPWGVRQRVADLKSQWKFDDDARKAYIHQFLDGCVSQYEREWFLLMAVLHQSSNDQEKALLSPTLKRLEKIASMLHENLCTII